MHAKHDGTTSLHVASRNANLDAVQCLFNIGGEELLMTTDKVSVDVCFFQEEKRHKVAFKLIFRSASQDCYYQYTCCVSSVTAHNRFSTQDVVR
jgi:hypothetical protein